MTAKIWLSPPHMGGLEDKYVREAFDSNWIGPVGSNIDGFENLLSKFLGGCHVALLSSGTAAIHVALIVLGVKQGDEVLVSDFTFAASANPVVYQGATPVFVDSELSSWNMDPELLEEAIRDRIRKRQKPKAIIVADIYGMPANKKKILDVAANYEIPVIEDSAEALGSKYDNQFCSTFGAMGALSFNGNKIITTSCGGALVSKNPEYIRLAKFISAQSREDTHHFEHTQLGYNYVMSNVLAGIGRGQMAVLGQRVDAVRMNNKLYREMLAGLPGWSFQTEPSEKYFSNFWLTSAMLNGATNSVYANDVLEAFADNNIDARPLMKPMHLQPIFKGFPAYLNGVSEYLFNNGLCLPSGSNLTVDDIERIGTIILNCYRRSGADRGRCVNFLSPTGKLGDAYRHG